MTTYIAQDGPSEDGYYDENLISLGQFLVANGYSRTAAAGIAGCVAGESGGNPESVGSGGGGLIGWTPLPRGMVTNNPTADLNYQFAQLLLYNRIWVQYMSQLNAQTGPVAAADFYSQYFERPEVTDSDVRGAAANMVYAALIPPPPPPVVIPQPAVWAYGPPGEVSPRVIGGTATVEFSWTPPSTTVPVFNDPEPPVANGYVVWVYHGRATAANLVTKLATTETSAVVAGLIVGDSYTVHVSASSPAPTIGKDVFATLTFGA